jgi:large subunit ribosomal protein L19
MTKTAIKFTPVDTASREKLDVKAGDTVRVWSKIQEKGKTRLQAFEGLVLARKHGKELGATLTVRKVSDGIGVERIFPLHSPNIDKIELVKRSKAKRSKLYFLRDKTNKEIRKKLKNYGLEASETKEVAAEEMMDEVVEEKKEEAKAE